jgi:hypothetical protein
MEMDDKRAIGILIGMLKKYPLTDDEKEAIREAVGILGWTKLIEGWKERKKRARDKRLVDL